MQIRILVAHGWEVVSTEQNCMLKWVYNFKYNTFSELPRNSKINHFPNSHVLTTKLGLCKTFRGQRGTLLGEKGLSHTHFYPRSYDLRYLMI